MRGAVCSWYTLSLFLTVASLSSSLCVSSPPHLSHTPVFLGGLRRYVVDRIALLAYPAADGALYQGFEVDHYVEDEVDVRHLIEFHGLAHRPGEAVQEISLGAVRLGDAVLDELYDEVVWAELARVQVGLDL